MNNFLIARANINLFLSKIKEKQNMNMKKNMHATNIIKKII